MRCRLIILGVLVCVLSLRLRPGAVWSEPLKEPAPVAVSDAVPAVVSDAAPGAVSVVAPVVASGAVPAAVPGGAALGAGASEAPGGAASGQEEQDQPVTEPPPKYIYIRHIRTHDFPQNEENPDPPRKIFTLELETYDTSLPYYSDIILDTNVGFGILRYTLGSAEADKLQEIELACYHLRTAPDDCSPEAIVIYNASAAFDRYSDQSHARTDIMDVLRRNADTYARFGTVKGLLTPASGGKGNGKSQEIRVAYTGKYYQHGSGVGIRLTFPPGQLKSYDQIHLLAREWVDYGPDEGYKDSRMPDSVELFPRDRCEGTDPNFPDSLRGLGYKVEFIREAYLARKGKKINILPLLVEDSFRMLPIHGPDGTLLP